MHTSTISDQTDHTRTGPLIHYDGTETDEYLSDSSSCIDNRSNLESDNYNNYESNYKSDNEEAPCTSSSITRSPSVQLLNVEEQKSNVTYTLKQEKFNNNFSSKNLLNAIWYLLSSPPRDISDDKVEDKLVIKIDQDGDQAPKFSVADDMSEVYGLPRIHECINSQKPLRAVIDIDASQEDIKTAGLRRYFQKCDKFIDRGLPGQNFNLRLIGSAKKGRVKRIFQFSLDNGWNKLDYVRIQPPSNLGLEVRPRVLSVKKNNNPLRIIVGQNILQKCTELVLQKHSNYLRDCTIEERDLQNFVYFNRKALLECPLCKCIHDKDQWWFGHVCASSSAFIVKCFRQNSDKPGEVFECDSFIAEKIQQENKNLPHVSRK
ncbi:14774_t:CDS:2, partial [Cetraspora pellucida]